MNVSEPTLSSFGTQFGLVPLINKSLAIISDARLPANMPGAQASQILERLLSISGEDELNVDRKYRDMWTGKLPCRLVMFSNELPRFSDSSNAISSRFVILRLTNSWLGKEDTGLFTALCKELSGILRWALDGLTALNTQGRLTEPESSQDYRETLEELTSPLRAFLDEHCVESPLATVERNTLYEEWRAWCEINGYPPGSSLSLGKNLSATVARLSTRRPNEKGVRARYYVGIGLHPDRPSPRSVLHQRSDLWGAGGRPSSAPAMCVHGNTNGHCLECFVASQAPPEDL